ncbi:MAG: TonB family protein [Clostridium sp.]|nr:TonB family protein [Clostridium sp.]
MTLLGDINLYEDEDEELKDSKYTYGIYKKEDKNDMSLPKCFIFSAILHPVAAGLVWLSIFILALLGITFSVFEKPQQKPKDIEFVLVNKEAEPINKNTKYRADRNSRAGGIHDPKRPVSQPVAASKPSPTQKAAPAASAPKQKASQPKQTQQKQQQKQPAKKQQKQKPAMQLPWAPKQTTKAPTPQGVPKAPTAAPRPALAPSAPKVNKPKGSFNIPAPKTAAPKVAGPSGGPITGSKSGSGSKSGGSGSGTKYSPSPSFSPSGSSSSGGRFSPGSAGRGGNVGNPGPGNPKGAPGIDAIKEPDFGPYMRELQRRIKMNWEPPKGNESKRVVLLFKIARDGRLISHRVYKSSGLPAADRAAMHAVELTAPFKPLPPEYKGDSVDIQFTFDYNVFGATTY